MSRPLRIEFPGALYHVTARGDRREDIFEDDGDRACLLNVVAQGLEWFDAQMLSYCLMSNHYPDWPWASYRSHVGMAASLPWLDSAGLYGYLMGQDALGPEDVARAQALYAELVQAGRGVRLWEMGLNQQIYLGEDGFVQQMQQAAASKARQSVEVPKAQRRNPRTLADWLACCPDRGEALRRAHAESGLSMTAMAKALGLSVARVSQLIAKAERA